MDRDSAENTRNKDPCRHFILLIIGAAALGVLMQATENFIVKIYSIDAAPRPPSDRATRRQVPLRLNLRLRIVRRAIAKWSNAQRGEEGGLGKSSGVAQIILNVAVLGPL